MLKFSSCGYVSCLNNHTTIDLYRTPERKEYIVLEGVKSREVDDLQGYENNRPVFWVLVKEIEKMIKGE